MSSRMRKSKKASSTSSRMMSDGRKAKAPPSTTKSSTLSSKGGLPERRLSRSSDTPVTARRMSVASSASSHTRKMSVAASANQGTATSVTSKNKSGDGNEGETNLKQRFESLMITKRMARSLRQRTSQRLADLRGESFVSYMDCPRGRSPSMQYQVPQIESTYQLEPAELFSNYSTIIHDIIESAVERRLRGMKYDPKLCSREAKELSEIIKEGVKTLDIGRYKLITMVNIGQMQGQRTQIVSRNSWDPVRDSFVSYSFQNGSVFCVATIYGVYFE
nr:uncharacterized protein LOC129271496 [Lytechinus pictus]